MADLENRVTRLEVNQENNKAAISETKRALEKKADLSHIEDTNEQLKTLMARLWWIVTIPALYFLNTLLDLFKFGGG